MQLENTSTVRVAGFLSGWLRSLVWFVILLTSNVDGLAQTRVYVPQVISGRDLTTSFFTIFRVFSLENDIVRIRIRTFQMDGEPFPVFFRGGLIGGGSSSNECVSTLDRFAQVESFTTPGGSPTAGWALIEVLDFNSGETIEFPITVAVTLESRVRGPGGDINRSTVLLPPAPTTAFSAFARIGRFGAGGATGMALLNPSETDAVEVTLQLVGLVGQLEEKVTVRLEPRRQISMFLNDPGLFSQLQGFRGSVEVRSTGPVSAAVIRVGRTFWSSFGIFPARPIPGLDGGG